MCCAARLALDDVFEKGKLAVMPGVVYILAHLTALVLAPQ
jgi:hypothetical protein